MRIIKKILAIFLIISIFASMFCTKKVKANTKYYGPLEADSDSLELAESVIKQKYVRTEWDKQNFTYGIKDFKQNIYTKVVSSTSKGSIYRKDFQYIVNIWYSWDDGEHKKNDSIIFDEFTRMENDYQEEGIGNKYVREGGVKSTPKKDGTILPTPEPEPELTYVTVCAKNIKKELVKGGNLYFTVTFDSPIKVSEAPILKVKIGDQTRQLVYEEQGNSSIIFSTALNDVKDCGKTITFESLSGGKVESKQENTITTMDYESEITPKDLGKVGNFIIVDKEARGDINKDERIDELDVKDILNCTDKKIADVNGDGTINSVDKDDLSLSIEKMDTKYINYLKVGNLKIYGDTNSDGVINYHDVKEIASKVGQNLSVNDMEIYDVDGNGKIDLTDVIFATKAIKTQDPMYLMHIKLNIDSYVDFCTTGNQQGILNAKDVLAIASLDEESKARGIGDVNGDGKVNFYDQIALSQMLYTNDVSKTKYFRVFNGANGDVNKDGFIDYRDVQLISKYVLNGDDTKLDASKADVNKDGKVDMYDSIKISTALEEADDSFNSKIELLKGTYFIEAENGDLEDVDGNGFIDYDDVKAIAEYLVSEDKKLEIEVADVNKDGVVNIYDAIEIMQKLNGKDSNFAGIKDLEDENKKPENGELGDVNGDGFINYDDAKLIAESLISEDKKLEISVADINGDGKVDLYDTIAIMEKLLNESLARVIMYGDVNQDNRVNIYDVVALNKYLINHEKNPISPIGLLAADVKKDGQITLDDSTILLNYVIEYTGYEGLGI